MFKRKLIFLMVAATLTACPNAANGGSGGAGTVSGRALDAQNNPIAGALVWVKPSLTTGLLKTTTDANGRYHVEGLPTNLPFNVYAWAQPNFQGKKHCLRLGHDQAADYESFVPTKSVVRDFRWKLEGVIEDRGGDTFFGGELRLMPVYRHDGDFNIHANLKINLKLTPVGSFIDGSPGANIVKTLDWNDTDMAKDIPVGKYNVSASQTDPNGTSPLEIGTNESTLGAGATLEFKPADTSCGGNFGNGTARAFLSIAHP